MKQILKVKVKNVYGAARIYPVDETGKGFAKLLGQKVFTIQNVNDLKAMGFTFDIEEIPADVSPTFKMLIDD